jgi:glycosyltransferase involved in cell wall biosynthesis
LSAPSQTTLPLVSVIIPTHDRPHFLPVILACYQHQTYPNRELIIIDDSAEPVDKESIVSAGGRLIRVERGVSLGNKLNLGVAEARGALCQRMDDDDWYGPDFMRRMVDTILDARTALCRPTLVRMDRPLFFDVARWELRHGFGGMYSGPTLLSFREDWVETPFRSLYSEDRWIAADQADINLLSLVLDAEMSFIQIRHTGHTWTDANPRLTVEEAMQRWPLFEHPPDVVFPDWALAVYRDLHGRLGRG